MAQKYQSEATQFLTEYKLKNPNTEQEQDFGRKLLWDKDIINLEEYKSKKNSLIKQKSYVYSND
jgi:Protein of unknown function (DUF3460)